MKIFIVGLLALLSAHVYTKAQSMKDPKETVSALFIATDQQDWSQVQALFDAQVLLDYESMNGNPAVTLRPDQIVAAWKGILPGFEATHHQLGNVLAEVSGDLAKVFCYGTATHYLPDEDGNVWTVVGSYDFELARQADGNWKVRHMKFNFKYQDGNLSLPEKAEQIAQGK